MEKEYKVKEESGFNSNVLKIIAIVIMIIDHFAYYFRYMLSTDVYWILRMFGRIAMPIFVYLIVQGYFNTKNIYKYIFNLFIVATITQISYIVLGVVNSYYFPNYIVGINNYLNILYSFVFSLLFIYVIDNKIICRRIGKVANYILRVVIVVLLITIYINVKIDYDYRVPFISIGLYILEKLYIKYKEVLKDKYITSKIIYMFCLILIFYTSFYMQDSEVWFNITSLLSIIPIMLYNGKRGKNNKIIKYTFYAIFPLQHIVLYLLGMLLMR